MSEKATFLLPQPHEYINQAIAYLRRMPRTPRFCQGDIYLVSVSQSGVHWRHSQGVKLGISNIPNYNNSLISTALVGSKKEPRL